MAWQFGKTQVQKISASTYAQAASVSRNQIKKAHGYSEAQVLRAKNTANVLEEKAHGMGLLPRLQSDMGVSVGVVNLMEKSGFSEQTIKSLQEQGITSETAALVEADSGQIVSKALDAAIAQNKILEKQIIEEKKDDVTILKTVEGFNFAAIAPFAIGGIILLGLLKKKGRK